MDQMRYYEVDVPATVTVFVQGTDLTPEQAMREAARYATSVVPTENEAAGYSSVAFEGRTDGLAISRTDIEVTGALRATDTTADQLAG